MKYYRILISAAVASVLTGCTEDKYLTDYEPASEFIGFTARMGEGGMTTRSVQEHLDVESETWLVETADLGTQTSTKGTPMTQMSGSVGITAIEYSGDWDEQTVYPNTRMKNDEFLVDGDLLTPVLPRAWRNIAQNDKVKFFAYAPFGDIEGSISAMDGSVKGTPYIDYDVTSVIADQTDLIFAESAEYTKAQAQTVPLTFNHALTAVQFKVGFDCTVKKLTVHNISSHGRFGKTGNSWGWTNQSNMADYVVDYGDGKAFAEGKFITSGDTTMMLVPQSFRSFTAEQPFDSETDAYIELEYLDENSADHTITASLGGSEWQMGRKVIYTVYNGSAPEIRYIYLDFNAGDIELTPTTYSGYVYVNGTATLVSGTHITSNRYYIYQSSTKDGSVGTPSQTGYASAEEFDTDSHQPNAGAVCRIPAYNEVRFNNKTWSEYVTNNTNCVSIENNWSTAAGNAGRTGIDSSRRIYIHGNSTYDLLLDNIWSDYVTTETGGIQIGVDTHASRTFREKVQITLKGDNKFHKIQYNCPKNEYAGNNYDAYLKFTSWKGDGSSEGSLTVTWPSSGGFGGLIGSGSTQGTKDNNGYKYRQVAGVYLNGGTIYTGSRPTNNSKWSSSSGNLRGCIGGANSYVEIYINGGTYTSVSNSTAAAIGGGGGHDGVFGNSMIRITGGDIYAYSFGIYSSTYSMVVPSTAIGGGNTVGVDNSDYSHCGYADIEITGGNIYAQSVGGVAIGGGCSGSRGGGNTDLVIKGGNIVAKSVSGTVAGYDVMPGTAIGGGRAGGGAGKANYNGGTANVEIRGGYVTAGSIGGGKSFSPGGKTGSADINIKGGVVSGQFVMAAGAATTPKFKMTGGTIRNSSTADVNYPKIHENGGAVYMEAGECTVEGGMITGCTATKGGAIYMQESGTESPVFAMSGGTIDRNTSSSDGGAVFVHGGSVTMTGGTISGNVTTDGNGGGVCVQGGSFTINGPEESAKIIDNTANFTTSSAAGNGGGLYVYSETRNVEVNILQGTVTGNTADRNGGGVGVNMPGAATATVTIGRADGWKESPYIANNSAGLSGGGLCVEGSNSNVYIKSGTTKGNVSAYVTNQDIRNDGGMMYLEATSANSDVQYVTVSFFENTGADPENHYEQRIVTSTNSLLNPPAEAQAFTLQGSELTGWNTKRDGTGTSYTKDGKLAGEPTKAIMNISEDLALYAQWRRN